MLIAFIEIILTDWAGLGIIDVQLYCASCACILSILRTFWGACIYEGIGKILLSGHCKMCCRSVLQLSSKTVADTHVHVVIAVQLSV